MMTRNDAVQQFFVLMTFNDTPPVLSTKNDGHCHHSRMAVFFFPNKILMGWLAGLHCLLLGV